MRPGGPAKVCDYLDLPFLFFLGVRMAGKVRYIILPKKSFLTPIEGIFYDKFVERYPKEDIHAQVWIKKFRVDFLIMPYQIIVECDGKEFHQDQAKDFRRDKVLHRLGYRIMRFTGSQIYQELVKGNTENNTGGYDLIDVVGFYMSERKTKSQRFEDMCILLNIPYSIWEGDSRCQKAGCSKR